MRQIELLKYSCPVCNADLIINGVDFSYDKDKGKKTKTRYKCIGCHDQFYSIEWAYVSSPDKTPEHICPYCHEQLCLYLSLKDDWTDYWECLPCKVSFQNGNISTYPVPKENYIEIVNMYTTINDKLYVLRQFIKENRSRIEMLPADEEDTVVIAQDFDFLFPNVLPTNIQQKLLTYLVFS